MFQTVLMTIISLFLLGIMAAAAGQPILVFGKKDAGAAARAELSADSLASAYLVFFPDLHVFVLLLASRLFSFSWHIITLYFIGKSSQNHENAFRTVFLYHAFLNMTSAD